MNSENKTKEPECYRCGYCGKRVDKDGSVLPPDEANAMDVDWDKATPVAGNCCG